MIYKTPDEFYFRIHHIRPRFKNNVEAVLLFMANEISKIPKLQFKEFRNRLNNSIRLFPGNTQISKKTIDNWRTEISAMFGFIQKNSIEKSSWAGEIALKLSKEQDLIQFFKYFLFYFQYPGGHLKSHYNKELITNGIKFKPAIYILKLLQSGENISKERFYINKAELTHCVFNDLRITRNNCDPNDVVKTILVNRQNAVEYKLTGDTIRYAGDILDYLVIANLLVMHGNKFYINWNEREAVTAFIESTKWFDKYDNYYDNLENIPFKSIEDLWFDYVNTDLGEELFRTDVLKYLGIEESSYIDLINTSIENIENDIDIDKLSRTKDIGDVGEGLILGHESMRMKLGNRADLIHLIKRIPNMYALGYDIQSVELDSRKRYIEVKTTISNKPLNFYNFHLTKNEWGSADTLGDRYFVYRVMLSKLEKKLFIIQNPVNQYKSDKLRMMISDGADIIFKEDAGEWTELLIWEN